MLHRRVIYVVSLIGCVIFYTAYQKWFSWMVLLTVLLLPWFSLVFSLPAILLTKLKLIMPEQIRRNSKAGICLKVHCPLFRPPFTCRIRVIRPNTGEHWMMRNGDFLPTDVCGGFLIRVERSYVYDYLGLFRRKVRKIPVQKVRILPEEMRIPVPPDLTRCLAKSMKPKNGGGYGENHDIRPYRPGDAMNQVHWKLSAKTESLMIREPIVPDGAMFLLTMDLKGSSEELERKFGRLLWLGRYLLEQDVSFDVRVLTGNGIRAWHITGHTELDSCIEDLLFLPGAAAGSVRQKTYHAPWQYHIGGEPDEG